MRFTKMQGCGNDYIYVNAMEERVESPGRLAKAVSDRHFGNGADGLILIGASKTADFFDGNVQRRRLEGRDVRATASAVWENTCTSMG